MMMGEPFYDQSSTRLEYGRVTLGILHLKICVSDDRDCKLYRLKAHEVICYHHWMGLVEGLT